MFDAQVQILVPNSKIRLQKTAVKRNKSFLKAILKNNPQPYWPHSLLLLFSINNFLAEVDIYVPNTHKNLFAMKIILMFLSVNIVHLFIKTAVNTACHKGAFELSTSVKNQRKVTAEVYA